ncbi:hypothetical protein GQ53DRAFT_762804 [Thozetella sp. PMI_491]|nr:hypothetical protein GQ53DRAFT_762804 [Thozetella sp. PMI_491]
MKDEQHSIAVEIFSSPPIRTLQKPIRDRAQHPAPHSAAMQHHSGLANLLERVRLSQKCPKAVEKFPASGATCSAVVLSVLESFYAESFNGGLDSENFVRLVASTNTSSTGCLLKHFRSDSKPQIAVLYLHHLSCLHCYTEGCVEISAMVAGPEPAEADVALSSVTETSESSEVGAAVLKAHHSVDSGYGPLILSIPVNGNASSISIWIHRHSSTVLVGAAVGIIRLSSHGYPLETFVQLEICSHEHDGLINGNPSDRAKPRLTLGGIGSGGTSGGNGVSKSSKSWKNVLGSTVKTRSDLVITSLSYAPNAAKIEVKEHCPAGLTQACYFYSSVAKAVPNFATITCHPEVATTAHLEDAKATASWASAHKGKGWKDKRNRKWPKTCDMDELPPAHLLDKDIDAYIYAGKDGRGQRVRYLPDDHNRGAGKLWAGLCFKSVLVEMSDAEFKAAHAAAPAAAKSSGVQKGMEFVQAAVTRIAARDPGFPLLAFDEFYNSNPPSPYKYDQDYNPPPMENLMAAIVSDTCPTSKRAFTPDLSDRRIHQLIADFDSTGQLW